MSTIFSFFRRRESAQPDVSEWWRTANAVAAAPTVDGIAALKASAVSDDVAPDVAEAQHEMIDGLDALVALATASETDLPVLDTQHRVIGADICHYMVPASMIGEVDSGGKVFVTSARVVFASGTVLSWPWHLIARVQRDERDLVIDLKGRPGARLRFNTYEGALVIESMVGRLTANRP